MALQYLDGQDLDGRCLDSHVWPHASDDRAGGSRASGDIRRRETSLWRFLHAGGPSVSRRPPPPSGRARRAHMPRRIFVAVAFGWILVLAVLTAVFLAIRWFG